MKRLQKAMALTAIIQCAATILGSIAVEAWDEVGYQRHQFNEASLLERDQKRFVHDESLLRKSVRHYADKAKIGELQDRVRGDLLDVVDDRGRPGDDSADGSSTLAKRLGKGDLS